MTFRSYFMDLRILLKIAKISQKSWFWGFLPKALGYTWTHKFWSRRAKNILRQVLESLRSIFSIFNIFLKNWFLFVTRTVCFIFTTKVHFFYHDTVLVTKRHQKLKFCWCKIFFWKVWTLSFPKPVLECFYDHLLCFYPLLKSGQNTPKKGGGGPTKKNVTIAKKIEVIPNMMIS